MGGSQLLQSIVREKRGQIMASRKGSRASSKVSIMRTLRDIDHEEEDDVDVDAPTEMADGDSVHSVMSDMSVEASDHGDIQDEVFEGYDDDGDDRYRGGEGQRRAIAKMSGLITMCIGAEKVKFKSFERRDALLRETECNEKDSGHHNGKEIGTEHGGNDGKNEKCLKILCRHFEARQQRLVDMKRTSSNVLSSSVMLKQ